MQELITSIHESWAADTASPDTQHVGYYNPRGQCAVTALVVQDFLGGELLRAVIYIQKDDGGCISESHYWNSLRDIGELDLTRAQYESDQVIPRGEVVLRSRLLEGERAIATRTPERYALLLGRVQHYLVNDV